MQKELMCVIAAVGIILTSQSPASAGEKTCSEKDRACTEFATLAAAGQFDKIIEKVDAKIPYSDEARSSIGHAYLMIAGRETNTPAQEEQFCLKALEYGATSAYMGLYFLHADQDGEKALGFLRQYITTKPIDAVPYVLLGEAEMSKENFEAANKYFREAKSLARGHSANLDWMLFKVNYLRGDFAFASAMLDGVLTGGQFVKELKDLAADPRFADLGMRPEFRRYESLIKVTSAKTAF